MNPNRFSVVAVNRSKRASRARVLAALSGLGTLFFNPPAARADVELALTYRAPPECPPRSAIRPRPDAKLVRPPSFDVDVRREGELYVARVVVRDGPDRAATRDLSGETCSEVVDASELVIALALGLPPPRPRAAIAPVAPPPDEVSRLPPAAGTPAHAFAAGLALGARSDVGPGVPAAVGVFGDWRPSEGPILSPNVRVAFVYAKSASIVAGGQATLTLATSAIEACPFALAVTELVRLRPCALVEGGALVGSSSAVAGATTAARLHLSVGAAARLEVTLGRLLVSIEGAAAAAAVRPTFFFEPDTTVFRAPAFGWTGGVGAGVLF